MHWDSYGTKKGFDVYKNLCSTITGKVKAVDKTELELELVEYGTFPGLQQKNLFSVDLQNDKGEKFLAYWLPFRMQDIIKPATVNLKLKNSKISNPVIIDLMSGKKYKARKMEKVSDGIILKNMPLADYPFLITEG